MENMSEESNKEQLKKALYGGVHPYFWCNTRFVRRLCEIVWDMGMRTVVIQSRDAIDAFLTEEEAGEILERLKKEGD